MVVDIYRAASLMATISSSETRHFSLRWQNSEYPRIFQVTGSQSKRAKIAIH